MRINTATAVDATHNAQVARQQLEQVFGVTTISEDESDP
jgi:hypothetical protein